METMSFLKVAVLAVSMLVHQGTATDSEKNENSSVPAPPGCADDGTAAGASTTSTTITTTASTTISGSTATGASTTSTTSTTTESTTDITTNTTRGTAPKRRMPAPHHQDFGVYFHANGCQYKVVKWYGKMLTVDCIAECGTHEVQLELGTPCAEVLPARRGPKFGSRSCRIGQCVRAVCTYKRMNVEVCRVPYASFHPGYHGRYRALLERYKEF
uniref:Evasin n=1 Tax=Rhipicephalus pulchellus TaxID=72859 RepID=L7M9V4_RHIPC